MTNHENFLHSFSRASQCGRKDPQILTAIIEPGEDGWFVATCPELDIVSQGADPAHAEAMLKEAVELWLECVSKEEVAARIADRLAPR